MDRLSIYVGVGIRTYKYFEELPQAINDVTEISKILEPHGYKVGVIIDPDKTHALTELDVRLPVDTFNRGGSLVVLWSGHGEPTPEGQLHLIAHDGKPRETPLITAGYLAGLAIRTGASQVLLILDTCYSGKAVIPTIDLAERIVRELPPQAERVWIGVIASAMDFEQARDGVFGTLLLKLLREGPSDPQLRIRWSAHNEGVRGDDLMDAIVKEWDTSIPERPKPASVGDPWVMFPGIPNPTYDSNAPDRVVEHLLLAARGVGPGEDGLYFSGRIDQVNKIVSWMQAGNPGLFVITGPPGSGKSAIAGRIVSLSNPAERSQILVLGSLEHLDPGEGTVHAHIYARGMTAERLCQLIDEQLVRRGVIPVHPSGVRNKWELLGAIERSQSKPMLVIDGLEEAGIEAWRIAEDVIRLLVTKCSVLVSTRERSPLRKGGVSLIQTLGPGEVLDLGESALEGETRSAVLLYITRRLSTVSSETDPAKIAVAIAHIAQEQREGLFLLARIITSQLLTSPVNTSMPGWEGLLDRGIEGAFEREIARLPALRRDQLEIPQAAKELLRALTWAYGSGLPDDIWPIVATAASPSEFNYQRDDIFWILNEAGRFVVEGGEGGRAVYRLAHQRLVEHLRPEPITIGDRTTNETLAAKIAAALVSYYSRLLNSGQLPLSHPYLWNYTLHYCADGGEQGITALRKLVGYDSKTFLPVLARALNNLGNRYSEVGKRQEAVGPTEAAVRIRRELAEQNPAFLPELAKALNNLGSRYRGVGKRQEAVGPTEEAVQIRRKLAEQNPAFLPELAGSLNNLGIRYSEVGKRQEAVNPTEEAVQLCRKLAEQNPAFLPDLARALNNLGNCYAEVGRWQEAVGPTEAAIQLYRKLAEQNPAFLPELAKALNNLGIRYREVGKRLEAVGPTEEAVQIRRKLADHNPAFLPELAGSLNNLGIRYCEVGRWQEAVGPTEAAVQLYRELAQQNPAFLPELAKALNNLGSRYREVGKRQEAVGPTEEAVRIRRELAEQNPAFLPDLASSLINLGNCYAEVGKRQEAVNPTEEAVQLCRKLAEQNPAFLPDLARALNNLGSRYRGVGKRQGAVGPTEEAVRIRRELAQQNPAFLPDLAKALSNLGSRYREVGRWQEAVGPTEAAVQLCRELPEQNPAFLPELAGFLNNLGNCYREVGKWQEAVGPTEEAVRIRRELAQQNPAFLPDLANSLNNLGNCYREVGKWQEAVGPTEEAVQVCRKLAEQNPAFLPDLANSLNNLGNCYRGVGKRQGAVGLIEAAVQLCRELAEQNPAFLPDLANSLNNLGNCYREVDKRQEAVGPTEEAVQVCRELAEQNPAFLPDLANSLNNLGNCNSQVGRLEELESVWEDVISSITYPIAKAFLLIHRAKNRPQRDLAAVGDLLAARAFREDVELEELCYRTVCRSRREQDPRTFDMEWKKRSGEEMPEWLLMA
jgi:tetratricopeptide (TPR) repeat protein